MASTALCACGARCPEGTPRAPSLLAPPALPGGLATRPALAPLSAGTFSARIERVRALVRDAGGTCAFVTSGTTSFAYLTGASIERSERLIALVVPASGQPALVVPSFEVERVKRKLRVPAAVRDWQESQSPFDAVREVLGAAASAVVIEPHTEYGTSAALAAALQGARLLDGTQAFSSLRVVKSDEELARIRRAIACTEEVFEHAFASLRPGVRDRDVSELISRDFEEAGFQGYALVQFGPLSALPHGSPEGAQLASESAVLIDGGCRVDGYWSDITRTRWFGSAPPAEFVHVVDVVREAQQAAIARARAGVEAQEVDRAARAVITRAGYGASFTHRLGHGLGMDGHEPIYMVEGNRAPLVPGCVFTAEPGIYLPGRFGVRIEDDVLCGGDGASVLTGA
jgi:Xaa-Pro dipeptidase